MIAFRIDEPHKIDRNMAKLTMAPMCEIPMEIKWRLSIPHFDSWFCQSRELRRATV